MSNTFGMIKNHVYVGEKRIVGEPNPDIPKLKLSKDQLKALNEIFAAFPNDNINMALTKKELVNTGIRLAIHHLNNYVEVEK